MADFQRVNGNACAVGTLYNLSVNPMVIQVRKWGGTPVDLRGETVIDGVVEQIVKEANPLAFYVPNDNSGNIHVVMDPTIIASDLQNRVRLIGANAYSTTPGTYANTYVGPNGKDISNTYVYDGKLFTVA
jgi:hypothetical protein